MVKSILFRCVLLFFLMFYIGCAGSGSGTNDTGRRSYHTQIGTTYYNEFFGVSRMVLVNKYQYNVVRSEESTMEIYFETAWKDRPVFADEAAMQITAAQTKFIVRAKPRATGRFNIHLYAENQVRYMGSTRWEPALISDMLKNYLDEISGELRYEFKQLY